MKSLIRRVLGAAARNDLLWSILSPFAAAGWLLTRARISEQMRRDVAGLANRLPGLVVMEGPFKGMRYPGREAAGSALLPKIAGTYEREIQAAVESLCRRTFETVIDVGSAEGYYAVGFALRISGARVLAFDIDAQARRLTTAMAAINGVSDRVEVRAACTPEALASLVGPRTLVVCDAEGFERELFVPTVAERLADVTCLIEFHDFLIPGIANRITGLFRETHTVTMFRSVDDWEKALEYQSPAAEGMSLEERRATFSEGRDAVMYWGLLEPKLRS